MNPEPKPTHQLPPISIIPNPIPDDSEPWGLWGEGGGVWAAGGGPTSPGVSSPHERGTPSTVLRHLFPERGRGTWTSPQPRGETKRPTLTQPAPPLRAGARLWAPLACPSLQPCRPHPTPPTLTCSGKSPNTDTISTPESCGQEVRPLVMAGQVGAHSGMWGDRRDGGGAPRAAEAPRPRPPSCAP